MSIQFLFFVLSVFQSLSTSPQLATTDNLYTAACTSDITDQDQNTDHSNPSTVWSTPIKGLLSPSIPYVSPPILSGSPSTSIRSLSIPYASPTRNEPLQTPTSDRSTYGMISFEILSIRYTINIDLYLNEQ